MQTKLNISETFPFRTGLSLEPLMDRWRQLAAEPEDSLSADYAAGIVQQFDNTPQLHGVIAEDVDLEPHRPLLKKILRLLLPVEEGDDQPEAVADPFSNRFIHINSLFEELLAADIEDDEEPDLQEKIQYAYKAVLHRFYGFADAHSDRLRMEFGSKDTAQHRIFEFVIDKRFTEISCDGEPPQLSAKQLQLIKSSFFDVDKLSELLPAHRFSFHGLIRLRAHEITMSVRLERIKTILLDRGSILNRNSFMELQLQLRLLLGCQDAALAIAALEDGQVLLLNSGLHEGADCIYNATEHHSWDNYRGSIFEKVVTQQQISVIADLQHYPSLTEVDRMMLQHGKRNIFAAPLVLEGRTVGVLTVTSPQPDRIDTINGHLLLELLPLFAHALQRNLDEFDEKVQRVIQDRFTAIHPTVHWRFRREAMRIMENLGRGENPVEQPIVFDHIYPLYSVTDIRGSSTYRNGAIQADLVEHLELAEGVLSAAYREEPLPIYDETVFRIKKYLELIKNRLSTGDELQVIQFLRNTVEKSFTNMQGYGAETAGKLEEYRQKIDPEAGTVYRRRKAYDESVMLINREISEYLDRVNPEAQQMFPHYFDKQATDGVDQNIYMGGSLVEGRQFSSFHLQNMRLWQLITMCRIAARMEQLKKELPVPLDTTHLIMVQDMPISIRFDIDEKKFRVDGAYNIRYEIMKKRIDKAVIMGSGERLTQPGRLAIVYSHRDEVVEYREYLAYLQARGLLAETVEEFELEDLQGIHGLKALRVAVTGGAAAVDGESVSDMILEAARS